MDRVAYDIELQGLATDPGTVDVVTLRDVLDALIDAAGRTLRLSVEGTSTRRGRHPEWMDRSVRFVVTGLREGSTVLPVEVPRLGDAAGPIIQQQDLWLPKPSPDDTALTLLARAVDDVRAEDKESERYDRGVLKALSRFERVVQNGEVVNVRDMRSGGTTFSITREHIRHAQHLERETPDSRAVILSGQLDMIEHSQHAFHLLTEEGRKIRGSVQASAVTEERMRDLWGHKVTLQGQAHFTPAGTLRFIEARVIRSYEKRDKLFEKSKEDIEEEATMQAPVTKRHALASDAGAAIKAIRGAWPGEETIDEILEALD